MKTKKIKPIYKILKRQNGTNKIISRYKMVKQKDGSYKTKTYKGQEVLKEDYFHKNCVIWFRKEYGNFMLDDKSPMLVHIANETPRSSNKLQMMAYNNKMKSLGKIKGIPDFFLRRQDGKVIFIELKAIDCDIKDEQKYIYDYLNQKENQCFLCKTEEEFIKVVNDFLLDKKEKTSKDWVIGNISPLASIYKNLKKN